MSNDKLITVLGATGTQGGAVARTLLADGEFAVRATATEASEHAVAGPNPVPPMADRHGGDGRF